MDHNVLRRVYCVCVMQPAGKTNKPLKSQCLSVNLLCTCSPSMNDTVLTEALNATPTHFFPSSRAYWLSGTGWAAIGSAAVM